MRGVNHLAVGLVAAAGLLAGWTPGAAAQDRKAAPAGAADYTRTTDRSYEAVSDAVKRAAKEHGFRVSNVHNIAGSLKKEGLEIPPYETIEVCNSRLAAEVLKAEPRLGAVMPCRIAVYRHGDKTVASMILPSRLMTLFPENPTVEKAAAQVDQAMKAIIDEATGAGRRK